MIDVYLVYMCVASLDDLGVLYEIAYHNEVIRWVGVMCSTA